MKTRIILFLITALLMPIYISAQQSQIKSAKSYIEAEKYLEAAKILRPLAEQGNAEAQYLAANLFLEGRGVIKSEEQAEKFYKNAALSGYEPAMQAIVDFYENREMYKQAAQLLSAIVVDNEEMKNTVAGFYYGLYLYHGKGGLSEDKLLGWELMNQAHEKVSDGAQTLETLHEDFYTSFINLLLDSPETLSFIIGDSYWFPYYAAPHLDELLLKIQSLTPELQKEHFLEWEKRVANAPNNDKIAYNIVLCMMYSEGVGVEHNLTKAYAYYSKVSNKLHQVLQSRLYQNLQKDYPQKFNNFMYVVNKNIQDRNIDIANPKVSNANNRGLRITRVQATTSQTIVDLEYNNSFHGAEWISLSSSTYIVCGNTREKYTLVKAIGIPLDSKKHYLSSRNEKVEFRLIFPALPHNTTRFDLIESERSTWKFYGIQLR